MIDLAEDSTTKLDTLLGDMLQVNYYESCFSIQRGIGLGFHVAKIDKKLIQRVLSFPWSEKHYSEAVWGACDHLSALAKREITLGFIQGSSVQKMACAIDEVMDKGRYNAERLVRTECKYFANQGEVMGYKESGIEEYQFLGGTEHSGSCTCSDLNGRVFRVDEAEPGVNLPPIHPNCLCIIRAYFKKSVFAKREGNAQLDDKTANAGDGNWNKYARDLDALGVVYNGKKNGYAWCDIFTDWCFIQTFGLELGLKLLCQAKKGVGAGCSGSANYYKQKGQFHTSGPQPGDQIFFTNDGGKTMYHTGIVEKVAGGRVYTIEGNTSSAAGVVENGGCVRDKSYALTYSKIGGYGRPDFSIVPEEDDDMDQNKFNEMFKVAMTAHQKELQDNDCGEWSREAREWAIRVGLFAGNGTTADGQPNYMWASPLTREQAAQLFYRFAQDHGLA